ncbi:hemagglutinin repeat-containing protein [Utexia brackfieldae]|uniref:two-partner secretion domain-containing protein n=1 Tax=Utexia brackfieldae TaxID=3074108 RepID=UPI00370D4635
MNKHFYRLVFSRARGLLIVVAEIACQHQGAGRTTLKAKATTAKPKVSALSTLCHALYLSLGLMTITLPAQATVVIADKTAPGNQQPIIGKSSNGTIQVDIQTPNNNGISQNKYSQFDVSKQGVILNNSPNLSNTELGGYIKGNDYLKAGGAKIILNEVNSKNASQLNGYIEVAGQKAQVIIANGAGITCDGCGFINADRSTLTTGTPIIENGQLKGYQVEQGQISITGKGLDATRADYTDLIARSVSVNAGLWANNATVVTGRNKVSADLSQVQPLADDDSIKPQLALDVSALGGMYAGKITMIGTETGVGVSNAGELGASAGSISITADGQIANTGQMQSQGDLTLSSQHNIDNHGQLYAKAGSINLTAKGDIESTNTVVAKNNIDLRASNIHLTNTAQLAAGVDEQGQLTQPGNLTAEADKVITLENQNRATGQLHLKADTLNNTGLIDSQQTMIEGQTVNNSDNGRIYGDSVAIGAKTLNNFAVNAGKDPIIASRGRLDLGIGELNNLKHAQILSLGDLIIAGHLNSQYQAEGRGQTINNHSAYIEAGQDMTVNVDTLNNINDDLQTDIFLIDEHNVTEYAFNTSPDKRYKPEEVAIYCVGCGDATNYLELKVIQTGQLTQYFNTYNYVERTYETKIVTTDPAKFISGGNLTINANTVTNDNSQIIAGKTAQINADELNNLNTIGEHRIVRAGQRVYTYKHKEKGTFGETRYYSKHDYYAYNPADEVSEVDLATGVILNDQAVESGSINDEQMKLPNSSLYTVTKDSTKNYLVETDPNFTNKQTWLSSDYMFEAMKKSPDNIQKRLGDGYYEQQLIKDQITALTGQRYLPGYDSDMEQYKQLMDAGVTFAQTYDLTIGVALTPEQMKALTTDMVWMVSKTVNIDGQDVEVLVPQVYIVNHAQVTPQGSLIAGKNVQISTVGDLNTNGGIAARDTLALAANNLNSKGVLSGDKVQVTAKQDINASGTILGDKQVSLSAGNNVNLVTTTHTETNQQGLAQNSKTNIDRVSSVQVNSGDMSITAGKDVNLVGAMVINNDADGKTAIAAGGDLNISTITTRDQEQSINSGSDYRLSDVQKAQGSEVITKGDLSLTAGDKLAVSGSHIQADKQLSLTAKQVDITSAAEQAQLDMHHESSSSSTFSKTKNTTDVQVNNQTQVGSQLSGGSVVIKADNDLSILGSQVASNKEMNLTAGNNVNIGSSEESYYSKEQHTSKTSGLLAGDGGIGFSVGKEKDRQTDTDTEKSYLSSMVGSTDGNVSIQAGQDIGVKGSDVVAKGDISLQGQNVAITADDAQTHSRSEYVYKKTGLTVGLTGTVADIYQAKQAIESAKARDNDTLTALQAIKGGLTVAGGALDTQISNQQGDKQASIGVSASFGSQKTERTTNQDNHTVAGAGISAGQNVTINATGNAAKTDGDITVQGSQVTGGKDVTLTANRDVNVLGAVNTQHTDKTETSSGSSVGVGVSVGGNQPGISYTASGNYSRERENAEGSNWTQGTVQAGNNLTVKTGQDANLIGGQLKGDSVTADIGNNLNIKSLQDSDNYDYEKLSGSISGSVGNSGWSANLSETKTDMNSKWASVVEQSGIFAGQGGYDVTVDKNTDLTGAVIASKAEDKAKNKLDTGTISFNDIENKADYQVNSETVNIGMGTGQIATPGAPSIYHNGDSASSTTKSAVEAGKLTIRDKANQQQDVADLSRDTADANNPLAHIFDKQKELDKIEQQQLINDIAAQAKDIANKYDRIVAQNDLADKKDKIIKDAEDKFAGLSEDEKKRYGSAENYANQTYYDAVSQQVSDNVSKNVGGIGSSVNKGIDAATSVITGILTGNMAGGLAGATAPYIAEKIKEQTGHYDADNKKWINDDPNANLIAHAVLGAVVAQLQGNSALYGAAGAAGGEKLSAIIRENLYKDKSDKELTESDKQNISNLVQLASGLASALASGGNMGDTGASVSASKNAVENNNLVLRVGWQLIKPSELGSGMLNITPELMAAGVLAQNAQIDLDTAKKFVDGLTQEQIDVLNKQGIDVSDSSYSKGYKDAILDLYNKSQNETTIAIDPNDKPKLEGIPIPEEKKPIVLENPTLEQDKNSGKLTNPLPEQDKNSGTLAGPEVDVGDWQNNILTSENGDPAFKNGYIWKPEQDVDLRGTGKNFQDALDEAFNRTGYDKSQFKPVRWSKTADGKSIPVEYLGPGGAEVNVDIEHSGTNSLGVPHIGYQVGRKGKTTGHILVDDVPANRYPGQLKEN